MTYQEYQSLLAEQQTAQQVLERIPAENVLDRGSFLTRLEEIKTILSKEPTPVMSPARVRLTFKGKPVVGSHGISAEFGTRATKAFADAIATMVAASNGSLSLTGPIPNREQHPLLITGTAIGSFGFELEEYQATRQLFDDLNPVKQALEQTRLLLQSTLGSDDDLTEAVAAINQRALTKIREFFELLIANEAVCVMAYHEHTVEFHDVEVVRHSLDRISQDNVQETTRELDGMFLGVLPRRRTFEFTVSGAEIETVITGKIGQSIADADELNNYLHQPTHIKVLETRVGSGRPRFMLDAPPQRRSTP